MTMSRKPKVDLVIKKIFCVLRTPNEGLKIAIKEGVKIQTYYSAIKRLEGGNKAGKKWRAEPAPIYLIKEDGKLRWVQPHEEEQKSHFDLYYDYLTNKNSTKEQKEQAALDIRNLCQNNFILEKEKLQNLIKITLKIPAKQNIKLQLIIGLHELLKTAKRLQNNDTLEIFAEQSDNLIKLAKNNEESSNIRDTTFQIINLPEPSEKFLKFIEILKTEPEKTYKNIESSIKAIIEKINQKNSVGTRGELYKLLKEKNTIKERAKFMLEILPIVPKEEKKEIKRSKSNNEEHDPGTEELYNKVSPILQNNNI